jgi:heme-degrading monooxygenase HmoA
MFARILEIAPSPGKKQELIYALNQEIVPIRKEQPGFVETQACLPENKSDRILSITFWTENRLAETYAKEAYPKVEQIMKPFLAIPITVKRYTVESTLSKRFVDILSAAAQQEACTLPGLHRSKKSD